MSMADDTWTREQNLMALWGYWKISQKPPGLIKEQLYREIGELIGRTQGAVSMKIYNFAACNASEPATARGLNHGGEGVQQLFDHYWGNTTELESLHEQLMAYFTQGFSSPIQPGQTEHSSQLGQSKSSIPLIFIEEGSVHEQMGKGRNRSRTLTRKAREHYRDHDGLLRCTVCAISFDEMHLPDVMEIHHLKPIAQYKPDGKKMPLSEALQNVRPLCPTCHKIVHAGRQNRPLDQVKQMRGP